MKRSINEIFKFRADRWVNYTPSVRPSPSEILIYSKMISTARETDSNCLILGATPELRDMACNLNLNVTVLDTNKYMINKMTGLMTRQNPTENVIVGNWVDYDFVEQQFDFILGDHVINMLPLNQYASFVDKLYSLLKKDGNIVTRIITVPQNSLCTNDEAIQMYDHGTIKYNDLIWMICLNNAYNKDTNIISYRELVLKGRKLFSDGLIDKETLKQFEYYDDGMFLSALTQREYKDVFTTKFDIVETKFGNDYRFCKTMPIYKLAKK
jgi:hypothetical protein